MKIFFSKENMGFYYDVIHKNIPDDAVEITQSEYQNLLQKQSEGYEITVNKKGKPTVNSK